MDIFCLYTVCWDVLTATVDKFRNGWNNHPISTAENFSPSQLFVMGLRKLKNSGEYHPELNQVIWFKIQLYCISWYLLNLIFLLRIIQAFALQSVKLIFYHHLLLQVIEKVLWMYILFTLHWTKFKRNSCIRNLTPHL